MNSQMVTLRETKKRKEKKINRVDWRIFHLQFFYFWYGNQVNPVFF